jgi:excinuclease UvrABC ATPase subunit
VKADKTTNGERKPARDITATVRTSEGLRDTLFDTLDGINAGKVSAQEAQAICKICAQINNSVNTEIEFYKHIGRHYIGKARPATTLPLGAVARVALRAS